ncbi:FAD-binding oxidoreductase [Millisia brevis]|uniref:FAD-binding oxidoreductase n=1 Tax=Millisia brevis TaxID=264148 RepID=UPI000A04ACBF|nr:FAD-binding oxidoreductase [Millisia brevis]
MNAGSGATSPDPRVDAQVVEVHRLRWDTTVIRLISTLPVPFYAGQALEVETPHFPGVVRRYYCALPPSLDGKLEFHVRTVPGGLTSETIVNDVRPNEIWRIGAAGGALHVDSSDRPAVMAAVGIGVAPMRAMLVELAQQGDPPEVFLFYADTFHRDLYALDALFPLQQTFDWLTVIPIVDRAGDPSLPDPYHDRLREALQGDPAAAVVLDPAASGVVVGSIERILASYEGFHGEQVMVAGPPERVSTIVRALIDSGTPRTAIRT